MSGNKVLDRADWDLVRRRVYALAGHRCEVCGGIGTQHNVEAAERWTYDDSYLVQTLVGVAALCPACHLATTPGRACWLASENPDQYAGLPGQVHEHLAAVNRWDLETTAAYIAWSRKVNVMRARREGWTSDWSHFERACGVSDGSSVWNGPAPGASPFSTAGSSMPAASAPPAGDRDAHA